MTTETPAILLTSADIDNIESERTLLNAEIASLDVRRAELDVRRGELTDRLSKIRALLDALGLGAVNQLSSNSLYATRHVKAVPHNGVAS